MRIRKNDGALNDEEILLMSKCSDAFAHPARIRMFRFIMERNKKLQPVCNKDIVAEFGCAQATASQHMNRLKRAGLITTENKDRFTYYYANTGQLMKYLDVTKKFALAQDQK
ncbi:MAG: metalloregulator ArsR/SmtB family transcription factor [Anaerovoracaceae bacterium]|nr:metalloregulator ArsR/SmtB family transcription factor [Anaerovoracaceae bacterium]